MIAMPFILFLVAIVAFSGASFYTVQQVVSSADVADAGEVVDAFGTQNTVASTVRSISSMLGILGVLGIFILIPLGIYFITKDKDNRLFGIGESISKGWQLTKQHFGILLGAMAIMTVFYVALIAFSSELLVSFVLQLIFFYLSIGFLKMSIDIVRSKKPTIVTMFNQYPVILKLIAAYILYALIVIAGYILLIVPGIIWTYKYSQVFFFIVDKKMGPIEALKASGVGTKGVKLDLFLWGFVSQLVLLGGLLALGVGLLVALPVISIGQAYIYIKIADRGTPTLASPKMAPPLPKKAVA